MSGFSTVGIVGGGAWGTALAQVAARAGLEPLIWAREAEVVEAINTGQANPLFLPEVLLDAAVRATAVLTDLAAADLILVVAPAQHVRAALRRLPPSDERPLVLCAKGVERGSLKLMTEVAAETAPGAPLAVLSGPSFAGEVARGLPTAVTLACDDERLGQAIAEALATPTFRPYWARDLIGAEAGGAIKNVLAIACGVAEGRGLGRSAHAALVTRGFAELTRLAVALGGEARTVAGLCGLGDLVLTCSSPKSRNMSFGLALGRGLSVAEALGDGRAVVEGYETAPALRELAARLGVETPICEAVAAVLAGERGLDEAIGALLSRPLRTEQEDG
ncbi:MAG TPA: NAD(P)H-dependent glycerol-3-phosphate dehydrogenase [Caulobacteraceae bacterium]|nr:NAD(P)H-dependent glycerol-3-phosphate dehydrogenase [Caulobacteraceae bacterium]